jgi:L-threonylcarbamoyladenylate synthase
MEPLQTAVDWLRAGRVVAFPTDTFYGLAADPRSPPAVQLLFGIKGRDSRSAVPLVAASMQQVEQCCGPIGSRGRRLAERFWPGPLSLIMDAPASMASEVYGADPSVAIRVPAHPVALALLSAAGLPVAAPSANLFSRPSPTRAEHVLEDLRGRIDMVIDAGPTHVGV